MEYKVVFHEYGYEFKSSPCSEEDADILLARLKDKGITASYKAPVNPRSGEK